MATIRVGVTPRTYADALALDTSACRPDSYSWKAELAIYSPLGGYAGGTTYTDSGVDPGQHATVVKEDRLGYPRGTLLGTYEVRVNVQSTVTYDRFAGPAAPRAARTPGPRPSRPAWTSRAVFDAPRPVIVGTPARGETLTAQVGTWSPEPSSQTLRWLRDGVAIPGATAEDYTLTAADVDTRISVEVRGALDQYEDLAIASSQTEPVAGDPWTSAPVPTIVGIPATGQTLTAADGSWDAGATLTHQWLRNGVAIPGATAPTYRLVGADWDTSISVVVTGRKPGSARMVVTSAATAAIDTGTITGPTPTIVGTLATGQQLTAVPGKWPDGTVFLYTWMRDGQPIWISNDPTYVLTLSESGRHISVQVMGTLDGCPQVFVTSEPTAKVMLASVPRVSGSLTVGSKVSARRGPWAAKAALRYQWLRDGAVIKGATGKSYRLRTADAGRSLGFRVSASLSGYEPVTLTSAPTLRVVVGGEAPDPGQSGGRQHPHRVRGPLDPRARPHLPVAAQRTRAPGSQWQHLQAHRSRSRCAAQRPGDAVAFRLGDGRADECEDGPGGAAALTRPSTALGQEPVVALVETMTSRQARRTRCAARRTRCLLDDPGRISRSAGPPG